MRVADILRLGASSIDSKYKIFVTALLARNISLNKIVITSKNIF